MSISLNLSVQNIHSVDVKVSCRHRFANERQARLQKAMVNRPRADRSWGRFVSRLERSAFCVRYGRTKLTPHRPLVAQSRHYRCRIQNTHIANGAIKLHSKYPQRLNKVFHVPKKKHAWSSSLVRAHGAFETEYRYCLVIEFISMWTRSFIKSIFLQSQTRF